MEFYRNPIVFLRESRTLFRQMIPTPLLFKPFHPAYKRQESSYLSVDPPPLLPPTPE